MITFYMALPTGGRLSELRRVFVRLSRLCVLSRPINAERKVVESPNLEKIFPNDACNGLPSFPAERSEFKFRRITEFVNQNLT